MMFSCVSFVIPVLESMVTRFALSAISYVCEVDEDGALLARIEMELAGDGISVSNRRFS